MNSTLRERFDAWLGLKTVQFLVAHATLLEFITRQRIRYYEWRNARIKRNHKCLWRCYRDGGGGQLVTPRPMTQERATAWVSRITNAEVYHVDFEHRFIFYRSRG